MLIVDNEPRHPAHLDDIHPNVTIVFLYQKTTSLLQPMDDRVTVRCKAYYRRRTLGVWLSARVPSTVTTRILAQNSTYAGSSGTLLHKSVSVSSVEIFHHCRTESEYRAAEHRNH